MSYIQRQDGDDLEDTIDQCFFYCQAHCWDYDNPVFYDAHEHELDSHIPPYEDSHYFKFDVISKVKTKKSPDYALLRPFFGWFSPAVLRKTFEHTNQYERLPTGTLLERSFKSHNQVLNVSRRNEPIACDTVHADTPAVDNGSTLDVLIVGNNPHKTDVYGIKHAKKFVNNLEDNIIQPGGPYKLISNSAQVIISTEVKDILRTLCISDCKNEPNQQQQNPAKRHYQTVKTSSNRLMQRTAALGNTWLLCITYVRYILNHTLSVTTHNVSLTHFTGVTMDISVLLKIPFWQKAYYQKVDTELPPE